jgi:hypothetical protein
MNDITQARLWLLPLAAAWALSSARAAASEEFPARKLVAEGSEDVAAMAFHLKDSYMTPDQWRRAVADVRVRYCDWERDAGGDIGRYLNDRLVSLGMAAMNGKVEAIQKAVTWMAFYKEFQQPPPRAVTRLLRAHRPSLTVLLTDFTWEKASDYVRLKQWRADAPLPGADGDGVGPELPAVHAVEPRP